MTRDEWQAKSRWLRKRWDALHHKLHALTRLTQDVHEIPLNIDQVVEIEDLIDRALMVAGFSHEIEIPADREEDA